MIERQVEYIVHPKKDEVSVSNIKALFSDLESDKASVAVLRINDDTYHVTLNIACEKEKMGFVMKAVKNFDKQYNEDTDSKITMKQLDNARMDDNNPKKKRDWAIPKGAFDSKSSFGIYKL